MGIKALRAATRTDRGSRRAENQDNVLSEIDPKDKIGLFAVADGMGGQCAGAVASELAIETLRDELLHLIHAAQPAPPSEGSADTPPVDEVPLTEQVRDAIVRCNERILRHADEHPETRGLGSTLTLALVKGSLAIIGNIGDSRTYRVRKGKIESLTRDHSLVAHLAAIGQIQPDDVYSHPQRSYIYRALGSEHEAQPDIFTERLQRGDTLLLCSDGLWEMVRDDGIFQAVAENKNVEDAAARLVDLAISNGGDDNVSVIVVRAE